MSTNLPISAMAVPDALTVLTFLVAQFKIGHTPRKFPDIPPATFRFFAYHLNGLSPYLLYFSILFRKCQVIFHKIFVHNFVHFCEFSLLIVGNLDFFRKCGIISVKGSFKKNNSLPLKRRGYYWQDTFYCASITCNIYHESCIFFSEDASTEQPVTDSITTTEPLPTDTTELPVADVIYSN